MNIKKIIGILITLLFIFILNNKVYGADYTIKIGETITIGSGLSKVSQWLNTDSSIVNVTYRIKDRNDYSTSATVKGLKAGEVTITCKGKDKNNKSKTVTKTVKVLSEEETKQQASQDILESIEDEEQEYKDDDYEIPTSSDAYEWVKFFEKNAIYKKYSPSEILNTTTKTKLENISKAMTGYRGEEYGDVKEAIAQVLDEGRISEETAEKLEENYETRLEGFEERKDYYKGKIASYSDTDTDRTGSFSSDVITDYNSYKPGSIDTSSKNKVEKIAGTILKVVSNIGMVASVLIIAVLGIKYMLGSVEDKAEYKQDLVPYFIGAVVLFGITTIVKVLQSLGGSINGI